MREAKVTCEMKENVGEITEYSFSDELCGIFGDKIRMYYVRKWLFCDFTYIFDIFPLMGQMKSGNA